MGRGADLLNGRFRSKSVSPGLPRGLQDQAVGDWDYATLVVGHIQCDQTVLDDELRRFQLLFGGIRSPPRGTKVTLTPPLMSHQPDVLCTLDVGGGHARRTLPTTAFYSSFQVQRFADDISTDLDCAMRPFATVTCPRPGRHWPAEPTGDRMREKMNHLLRTEDFTELEAALRTADGHLEQNAPEEAFGELRRAQVQVETLQWLARRFV